MALSSNSSNEDKYLFSTLTIIVLFLVVMSLLGFTLFSINYAFAQPGDNSPPAGIVEINGNQPSTSSNIVTLTLVCNDGANGVGCSGITLSWDNIDANQSPQSVDQIPNILVTSESDTLFTKNSRLSELSIEQFPSPVLKKMLSLALLPFSK